MNNLQPLQTKTPIIITLNPSRAPDEASVHDCHSFDHPVFDNAAIEAQRKIPEIQGKDRIWYCGAWQRYGFHEDGLLSAVNVAEMMGIEPEWK
jgi:predicted NAD/FAD-binding protein